MTLREEARDGRASVTTSEERVLLCTVGAPLSICEAECEARRDRKRWGNPATIVFHNDDESSTACMDAVSGKHIVLGDLFLIDSYDEAYLRVMGLDFTRMSMCHVLCCCKNIITVSTYAIAVIKSTKII